MNTADISNDSSQRSRKTLVNMSSIEPIHTDPRSAITFSEGQIDDVKISVLTKLCDDRGWLCELYREDDLASEFHPVMGYLSVTQPGVVRGPHEHRHQADLFAFLGPGDFCLYLWDARTHAATYRHRMKVTGGESNPLAVIVPPGVVHAYQNVSPNPGTVINLPNRLYRGEGRREEVDEIRHEDDRGSSFRLF